MEVIHSVAWYFPESNGGTEVYAAGLAQELAHFGVINTIVAPQGGPRADDYVHDGVRVHRYPSAETTSVAAIRGEWPPVHFDAFVAWLGRRPRGIYHQHSWTTNCGAQHLRAAKELGFKTVLTIHVAGVTCLRGTMLEFGRTVCDGGVAPRRCAACWSQGRGLPRLAARALGHVPHAVGRTAYRCGIQNRAVTAFAAREIAAVRRRQIAVMAETADRIVVVAGWLKDVLSRNGIFGEKVVLSRQGVGREFVLPSTARCEPTGKFRFGFIGRCDELKGLPLLLAAVDRVPRDLPLDVVIHAVANTDEDRRLRDRLVAKTASDSRITFRPPLERAALPGVMASFDMLAVPSQCMETGPLVVMEAQALGVPVLGSDLGGIAELVSPGLDGYLIAFDDAEAWADAIRKAIEGTLPGLSRRVPRSVRTMADAARDMSMLYAGLA